MSESEIARPAQPGGTVTVRQDAAGDSIITNYEVATAAAVAAARAEHEGRIVVAQKSRRDEDQATQDIMRMCKKPAFAGLARYQRPQGKRKNPETGQLEPFFIEGLSIRFVEMALQYWGNMFAISRITYEDNERAMLNVTVSDLQRNSTYSTDAMVEKLVERREVKTGRTVLGMRENSYGDKVYLVRATPEEFRNVIGAERSKLIRDNGLRLLPRDVQDEARALIEKTVNDETAKDPDGMKKKVLGQFAVLGVSASMLKEYLEQPIETLSIKGLQELAVLHTGLKDGEFSWADVMRVKREPAEGEAPATPSAAGARAKLRESLLPKDKPADTKPTDKPPEK